MGACGSSEVAVHGHRTKKSDWVRARDLPVDDSHPEVYRGQSRKTAGQTSIVFHIQPICPKEVEALLREKQEAEKGEAIGEAPLDHVKCPPTPSPTPATLDLKNDLDNISLSHHSGWGVRGMNDNLQLDRIGRGYPLYDMGSRGPTGSLALSQVSGFTKRESHATSRSCSSGGVSRPSSGMPVKRGSFMSLSSLDSSSHTDRLCASSLCSYTVSEGSTCLEILHELSAQPHELSAQRVETTYKTQHQYEINVRPFGMRLTDLVVSHLKGEASKAGIRLGDELQKINGNTVSADNWAAVFSSIQTPFTITLIRVNKGSIGRSEPSHGYDTETGIARRRLVSSTKLVTDEKYNSDNIIAGKIPRHLSPKRKSPNGAARPRWTFPSAARDPSPTSSEPQPPANTRPSPRLEPIDETPTNSAQQDDPPPPAIPADEPAKYCSDSIYAGRLRREISPHKSTGEEAPLFPGGEVTPKGVSLVLGEAETPTAAPAALDPRSAPEGRKPLAPGAATSPGAPQRPPSIDIAPLEAPSHIMENLPEIKLT